MRARRSALFGLAATVALGVAVPGAGAVNDAPTYGATAMRGDRYCELLLLQPRDGQLVAQVWATAGLNDCPEAEWAAVDPAVVARDENVALVLRNGPRYWLIDSARRSVPPESTTRALSGLEMRRLATVALDPADIADGAYQPRRVVRNTTMTWPAGKRVYELVGPDGAVYVMQSWSQQIDPALVERDLRTLDERLDLPQGWSHRTRVLRKALEVGTDETGAATVVQDELMNSYSLRKVGNTRPSQ